MRLFILLLALSTCIVRPSAANNDDDSLDIVASFEIVSADPTTTGTIFTRMAIAETLVDADRDGNLIPKLATRWQASDDGLHWTFTLRDGVTFHDGTPFSAETAINALEIARAKPGLLAKAPIESLRADNGALVVTLSEPLAALPAFIAEYRSQILAPAAYGADGMVTAMIGTGPYRVTEMTPPTTVKAEAFADYWGAAPTIPRISYNAVSRAETRALMAESDDAEFVYSLDPASVSRLSQREGLTVQSTAIPRSLILKLNNAHPFMNTPDARRALSLAIDRNGIAKAVLRYPEGADQLFPPSVSGWHNDAVEPLGYDPERAKVLLAELGWRAGDDGILVRDGERFALTLLTYPDRPELPLVAAVLEQQFRQIGVDITINNTSFSEIPAGHQDGTLELALFARNFALVPDPIGTLLQDYAPGGDWGAMGWHQPAFVDLVKNLSRGSVDDSATARLRAAAILQQELPVIPIAWYRQTLAVSDRIRGVQIDPWERTFGLPAIGWSE